MAIVQADCKTTWEELNQDNEAVLVDVRTVEEFAEGHPQNALNIPVLFRNPGSGQMMPNPDFEKVVSHHVPKGKKLYLSCRSGKRSMMAAMRMEAQGYEKLVNVKGGFAGSDEDTGWQDSGLPVSQEHSDDVSYSSLLKKTNGS